MAMGQMIFVPSAMTIKCIKKITSSLPHSLFFYRHKTTAYYRISRFRDATLEKFIDNYKILLKVIRIQDVILANQNKIPPSVSVDFLNLFSLKLSLKCRASTFIRRYPCIFEMCSYPSLSKQYCKLTPAAVRILNEEAAAINNTQSLVLDRLTRLLSMTLSKTLPLREIYKVEKELGLPDDFKDSILSQNPHLFQIVDAHNPNTRLIKLVDTIHSHGKLSAAVENWRIKECCADPTSFTWNQIRFSFKHGHPRHMNLKKKYKAKVDEWQKLPYIGPYDEFTGVDKKSKTADMEIEKRAVAIVHEFLSLTVEKMVAVKKICRLGEWFGIDLNVKDLFYDHPGIFYMSTKGIRHTVFLREAYVRGCLIDPNPVSVVRRKLLDLVILGRQGLPTGEYKSGESEEDDDLQEIENEQVSWL